MVLISGKNYYPYSLFLPLTEQQIKRLRPEFAEKKVNLGL